MCMLVCTCVYAGARVFVCMHVSLLTFACLVLSMCATHGCIGCRWRWTRSRSKSLASRHACVLRFFNGLSSAPIHTPMCPHNNAPSSSPSLALFRTRACSLTVCPVGVYAALCQCLGSIQSRVTIYTHKTLMQGNRMFQNVTDLENLFRLISKKLTIEDTEEIAHRVGLLNLWNPLQPGCSLDLVSLIDICIYLNIYLSICLSIYLSNLHVHINMYICIYMYI